MANNRATETADLPPTIIPARRFHESMATVLRLAQIFGSGEAKIAREANLKSQLEWGMDMDWLDKAVERWSLSDEQRDDLARQFRERHRQQWGAFAYMGE